MQIGINARKVTRVLTITILLLVTLHAGLVFSRHALGHGRLLGIGTMFDLDEEFNPAITPR
jgi:hypothetical protein